MEIIVHQAILHVLDTTLDAPVLSGSCMEKMLSAYSPKDSLLKKLPHFPIICPIRSPMQARSAICQKDFFRILQ